MDDSVPYEEPLACCISLKLCFENFGSHLKLAPLDCQWRRSTQQELYVDVAKVVILSRRLGALKCLIHIKVAPRNATTHDGIYNFCRAIRECSQISSGVVLGYQA